jgi:AcrR family transcriptional regulator
MTCHVIRYAEPMNRWEPDARSRLERAAWELVSEQGFAATTVPQITARAGLTTRTFHRHFSDKREVLFAGEDVSTEIAELMATTPPSTDALSLIVDGLVALADSRFEGRRAEVRTRRDVIRTDAGLRERELQKQAAIGEAVRVGLMARGEPATRAALLAETCVTLLNVSIQEWLDNDDGRSLADIITATLESLRSALKPKP